MNAYWIPGSFIAIGLLLLVVFHSAPRYTDPEWRKRVPEMDSEAFYREQERSLTYSVLSLKPGSNQASERSPKERRGDKTSWTKPRSSTAVWTMGIVKARSS